MDRGGGAGEVVNLVHLHENGLTNVVKDEVEVLLPVREGEGLHLAKQVLDVLLGSGEQVVDANHFVTLHSHQIPSSLPFRPDGCRDGIQ